MKQKEIFDILFKSAIAHPAVANAKIVSCIIFKNNIISFGFNSLKTHPFQQRFSKNKDCIHLHAEIDAIKNALRYFDQDNLSKCSLYVLRVRKEDRDKSFCTGISKPCIGCMRAILTFNIKNVFYTEFKKHTFSVL